MISRWALSIPPVRSRRAACEDHWREPREKKALKLAKGYNSDLNFGLYRPQSLQGITCTEDTSDCQHSSKEQSPPVKSIFALVNPYFWNKDDRHSRA